MLNPMNLVTETVFQGFHDRDDPGMVLMNTSSIFVYRVLTGLFSDRSIMSGVSFPDKHRVLRWKRSHDKVLSKHVQF